MIAFASYIPFSHRIATLHAASRLFRPSRSIRLSHPSPSFPSHNIRCSATTHPTQTMKQNRLGNSDIMVSEVCLGTMTWGVQNTEEEAHEQMDYAISRGVNFLDTAEVYPVPSRDPRWKPGRSEEIIGRYISKHPELRSKLVIATKISGFNLCSESAANRYPDRTFKDGQFPDARHDPQSIYDACQGSLKRLQTDYIDLYQLHWPDRYIPVFGKRTYRLEQERSDSVPIKDTLIGLKRLLDEGKIRAYGLSNETTFGLCEFVRLADEIGMPRPVSIQNAFSLLTRAFESELAEACAPSNYNIGLLPWSILGGGTLTGKYNGKLNANLDPIDSSLDKTRFIMFKGFMGRFCTEETLEATEKYVKIAKAAGMSVGTLAQAFCKTRWYIPSSIIGATTMPQLKENIDAFEVELSDDVLAEIDDVHRSCKDIVVGL